MKLNKNVHDMSSVEITVMLDFANAVASLVCTRPRRHRRLPHPAGNRPLHGKSPEKDPRHQYHRLGNRHLMKRPRPAGSQDSRRAGIFF